jgi:hypothetical protein
MVPKDAQMVKITLDSPSPEIDDSNRNAWNDGASGR